MNRGDRIKHMVKLHFLVRLLLAGQRDTERSVLGTSAPSVSYIQINLEAILSDFSPSKSSQIDILVSMHVWVANMSHRVPYVQILIPPRKLKYVEVSQSSSLSTRTST